jgi:hypothetical protein
VRESHHQEIALPINPAAATGIRIPTRIGGGPPNRL